MSDREQQDYDSGIEDENSSESSTDDDDNLTNDNLTEDNGLSEEEYKRLILERAASLEYGPEIRDTLLKNDSIVNLSEKPFAERAQLVRAACKNFDASIVSADSGSTNEKLVPVIDVVSSLEPILADDLVVLSDGQCYSRMAMRNLLEQGVVDIDSGRATLPLSGDKLVDLDYALLGQLPPRSGSLALKQSRLRTRRVIAATMQEAVRTREQSDAEQQARTRMREQRRRERFAQFNRAFRPSVRSIPEEN